MSREPRPIPIHRSDYNVIETEFGSMRDKFESEMQRVEEEMARLKREFEGYTPKMYNNHGSGHQQQAIRGGGSPSMFQQHSPGAFANGGTAGGRLAMTVPNGASPLGGQRPRYDPYLDSLKSPLIKDESDGKTLKLRFNVNQYLPEEVTVKTVENRLLVHAKHEEKSPQRSVYREYNQEFMLPRGTDPETISSTLSVDGILTVTAPLPAIEAPPGGGYQQHAIQHR